MMQTRHFLTLFLSAIVLVTGIGGGGAGGSFLVPPNPDVAASILRDLFEDRLQPLTLVSFEGVGNNVSSTFLKENEVVRVGLFHFPPFTFETLGADGTRSYSGVEVSLVKVIIESLGMRIVFQVCWQVKFKFELFWVFCPIYFLYRSFLISYLIQTPSDGQNHWGVQKSDGNWTGLLGDVYHGIVDVGMAEFFDKASKNRHMDPSEFYFYDHFCFVQRKPEPVPHFLQVC